MKLVNTATMRELDRRTIEEFGTPGQELMERAGRGVAEVVRHLADISGAMSPAVLLLAGRGNNGGDCFCAARYLKDMGFDVYVWLAGSERQVQGDALKHLGLMRSEGLVLEELGGREEWDEVFADPPGVDFIVDGLLGTGSTGPARGPVARAIQYINTFANEAFVVSIDLPSGIDSDTGVAEGDAVNADITVTLGLPKKGLVAPAALEFVGCVEVVDLGLPPEYVDPLTSEQNVELIYSTELRRLLPRRARSSHKGTYGHVLLIAGARGYAGAAAMACRAAARSGAGLTTALVPASIATVVAGASPETMVHGAPETEAGSISAEALQAWEERVRAFDAVLVGPGLTTHADSAALVRELVRICRVPLVMDADALNVLAGQPQCIDQAACPVIITPHPGELARLVGCDAHAIQSDRCGTARAAADRTGATVVLKGAGTVVVARDRPAFINMTGNPGMATGGSGDVLAGLLAGLLGQGLSPFDAAKAGVFLHGRAGDMAAWRSSQAGLVAGDIIQEIPYAFREITLR